MPLLRGFEKKPPPMLEQVGPAQERGPVQEQAPPCAPGRRGGLIPPAPRTVRGGARGLRPPVEYHRKPQTPYPPSHLGGQINPKPHTHPPTWPGLFNSKGSGLGKKTQSLLLSVVPEGAVLGATATLVPTTKGCGVIAEGLRAMGVKPQ